MGRVSHKGGYETPYPWYSNTKTTFINQYFHHRTHYLQTSSLIFVHSIKFYSFTLISIQVINKNFILYSRIWIRISPNSDIRPCNLSDESSHVYHLLIPPFAYFIMLKTSSFNGILAILCIFKSIISISGSLGKFYWHDLPLPVRIPDPPQVWCKDDGLPSPDIRRVSLVNSSYLQDSIPNKCNYFETYYR